MKSRRRRAWRSAIQEQLYTSRHQRCQHQHTPQETASLSVPYVHASGVLRAVRPRARPQNWIVWLFSDRKKEVQICIYTVHLQVTTHSSCTGCRLWNTPSVVSMDVEQEKLKSCDPQLVNLYTTNRANTQSFSAMDELMLLYKDSKGSYKAKS